MDVSSAGVGEDAATASLSALFMMRSFSTKTPITILKTMQKYKQRRSSTQSEPRHGIQFGEYLEGNFH